MIQDLWGAILQRLNMSQMTNGSVTPKIINVTVKQRIVNGSQRFTWDNRSQLVEISQSRRDSTTDHAYTIPKIEMGIKFESKAKDRIILFHQVAIQLNWYPICSLPNMRVFSLFNVKRFVLKKHDESMSRSLFIS